MPPKPLATDGWFAGDLIGFSSSGWSGWIINLGTRGIPGWSLSHVGIVAPFEGRLALYESTTLNTVPCLRQKKMVQGTQVTDIKTRITTYKGKVWRYPVIKRPDEAKLQSFLTETLGTPYDKYGAFGSRNLTLFQKFFFRQKNDINSLFCSEWCAAAMAMGGMRQFKNVSLWNPNGLGRLCLREKLHATPIREK